MAGVKHPIQDRLFAEPMESIADFSFDAKVAAVFEDMVRRSVPGYRTIIEAIGLLGREIIQPDSLCYDLGCSLGAASLAISHSRPQKDFEIIAVDNSWPMVNRCREEVRRSDVSVPIHLLCTDIRNIEIQNASLVVLNFTLQFVPVCDRLGLLKKIYDGLLPGGALVLSEKIALASPALQSLFDSLHHAFKKAQGYSELEIVQKRSALEKVLIPEPLKLHQERLLQAGFDNFEVWFQYFNFVSMVALK